MCYDCMEDEKYQGFGSESAKVVGADEMDLGGLFVSYFQLAGWMSELTLHVCILAIETLAGCFIPVLFGHATGGRQVQILK